MIQLRGFVALLLLGAACGGGGVTADQALRDRLAGRGFVSESVTGRQLVAGTRVALFFDDTDISAQAGCNALFGPYALDGATLHVTNSGQTGIGCSAALSAQDDWLATFLLASPTLVLNDPKLVLTTSDASITLVDRKLAFPDEPLVGTSWLGNGFSDGMVARVGPGSTDVTLQLSPDGHVLIDTSCQHGNGSFAATATTVTFTDLTYDTAGCSDGTFQATSDEVRLVLDGAPVTFVIKEGALTVTHGRNALLFHAAPR